MGRGKGKGNIMQRTISPRMLEGARNYAAADNSDPFALARAMTHLRNGIASFGPRGEDAFYSAEPYPETRQIALPQGGVLEWQATAYKNRIRP